MNDIRQELLELGSWLRHEQKRRFPVAEDSEELPTLYFEYHNGKTCILNAKETMEGEDFFPAW